MLSEIDNPYEVLCEFHIQILICAHQGCYLSYTQFLTELFVLTFLSLMGLGSGYNHMNFLFSHSRNLSAHFARSKDSTGNIIRYYPHFQGR